MPSTPIFEWYLDSQIGRITNFEDLRAITPLTQCFILEDWLNILKVELQRAQHEYQEGLKNAHKP